MPTRFLHECRRTAARNPPAPDVRRHATVPQSWMQREHWEFETHRLWDVYFGPVKLGRMNERILRIEDHKGRIVRRGPAQTAALTRRGNTHHVLPMSLD